MNSESVFKKKGLNLLRKTWRIVRFIFLWLFVLQFIYIVLLKWVNPPITITQFSSWVKGYGMKRKYIPGKSISFEVKLAVVASEDQHFLDHSGFDWKSLKNAIAHNQHSDSTIRGGSTISQQVAKNVFLWQGKSWLRKGLEAYFTFMIEKIWGKERILEVYLNVIETGDGIFGIEQAAQHYFGKSASLLTREEAALIAATLPNPHYYSVKPLSPFVKLKSEWILRQMKILELNERIQRLKDSS